MALRFIILGLCMVGSLAVPTPSRIDPTLSWRIIGGEPAPEGRYRYIVSLQSHGSHNCGGSAIHKNYVITAAHCVYGQTTNSWTIKAGITKLSSPGQVYKVLKIKIHEDFDHWNLFNDIALLEVEEMDISFSKILTIGAKTEAVQADKPFTLIGWGSTTLGGLIPDHLQQIDLTGISLEACQEAHGKSQIRDTQICTLTKTGEGACQGDSGGPLITRGEHFDVFEGIVSWGIPCAQGQPDVFTRVFSFSDWIDENCDNCLE